MADLRVNIAGVPFENPLIAASGTFGFGHEYQEFYPLSTLGGISCKGTTLNKKDGNIPPRIAETPSGILNSVGLQNPGVDKFINYYLPRLRTQDTVVIANIAGAVIDDYIAVAEKLDATDVDMIELNISCPNVKQGGATWGVTCEGAASVTRAVRNATKKPVIVKLTPNVTNITEIAKAAEAGGADAVSLINTLTGMKIDINRKTFALANKTGGVSGPIVKPIAVRMVYQVAQAVNIPIIGMGGISCAEDAIEFILAGASAVSVGTANFHNPAVTMEVIDGIEDYMKKNGFTSVKDMVGIVR